MTKPLHFADGPIDVCTLGPAYNEFGYNEHPTLMVHLY